MLSKYKPHELTWLFIYASRNKHRPVMTLKLPFESNIELSPRFSPILSTRQSIHNTRKWTCRIQAAVDPV